MLTDRQRYLDNLQAKNDGAALGLAGHGTTRRQWRWLLPIGLFFLAPFVGEFLLGNQPITALPGLLLLAPMYGGGAVLVREVARHTGAGWRVSREGQMRVPTKAVTSPLGAS